MVRIHPLALVSFVDDDLNERERNSMNTKFEISSDLEFYCYLKAHLPSEYEVVSQPHKSYYSEWHYHYVIYHQGEVFEEYSGSFEDLEKGDFIREAQRILKSVGE